MDVWITAEVRGRSHHIGLQFEDSDGNTISVGNDCKVIHIKDSEDLMRYFEYHAEFEAFSYRLLYNDLPPRLMMPPRPKWDPPKPGVQPPQPPKITFEEPA